jgi:hypothetical protein
MIRKLFVVAIFVIVCELALFSDGYAASNKEETYELQERCGKQAAEYFKQEYGNGTSGTKDWLQTADYSNHYNKINNKCFVLLTISNIPYKDKASRTFKMLFDLNEHKEYGGFLEFGTDKPSLCKVSGTFCNSEDEWDALAKPFIEE